MLEQIYGANCYIFQQDGAPAHRSQMTKAALSALDIPLLEGWPAHSPDLSPIEMIWDLLKSRCNLGNINSPKDLDDALIEAWNSIDLEMINHYIESFEARLIICKQINGASLNGHWKTVHQMHH
jgi:transposase